MAGVLGKPCREPRCANIVAGSGPYCEVHAVENNDGRFAGASVERLTFYSSARWQRLRKIKLGKNPICEICNAKFATQVHHLEKARDNIAGRYEITNLQSVCVWCHARETQRETTQKRMERKKKSE